MSPAPLRPLHLKLPATSANLGPGFDALGLALSLYLTIDAEPAPAFRIEATGRNADLCARVDNNLILTTYTSILPANQRPVQPLLLRLHNQIPLGMGLGSSAAALLAGVLLANHFGGLNWSPRQILFEACRREGHPDNVAACYLGGMTASSMSESDVITSTCGAKLNWKLLLALPSASLATEKARALLPPTYSRADAVANIQSTALLVSAFALDRPDLLRAAMADRIHQRYRMAACPLLPLLLPLAHNPDFHTEIHGVALSGAGPSVLLVASPTASFDSLASVIRGAAHDPSLEIIETTISSGALQA
jgi:homoserine kinase